MKSEKTKKDVAADTLKKGKNSLSEYLHSHRFSIIVFLVTFAVCAFTSFIRIASNQNISVYNIEDYAVGQVAFETIKAPKDMPATEQNPVEIHEGELITKRGFVIDEVQYAKLQRMAESPAYKDYRGFAQSVLYLLLLFVLFFFFTSRMCLSREAELKEIILESVLFAFVYIVASVGMRTLLFSSDFTLTVILPSSFCVFIVAILFGHLGALFFSVITALGVFNASGYMAVPFIYVLATSIVSARIMLNISRRNDMVVISLLQAALNVLFLFLLKIIFAAPLSSSPFAFAGVAINGFISGILCLGFLTPLELILNTSSVFRLLDLTDLNAPIIKKMQQTASGTYNHSVNVANLAEAACSEIGANALLARVGAIFHDIGKLDNPEYFTENQRDKESNIHNTINPSLSVSIIRSHVKKGVEKARELHLPPKVIQIIAEHHGNQVIEYFFREAKEKDPNTNPADYSYMGNPPSTRESAVVMLADTVEAACHSLDKNPSYSFLDERISMLINHKIEQNQMNNCGLSFKDMRIIHDVFLGILAGYYHSRVKYPGQTEENTQSTPQPAQAAKAESAEVAAKSPAAAPKAKAESAETVAKAPATAKTKSTHSTTKAKAKSREKQKNG